MKNEILNRKVAPSLLAADFMNLLQELRSTEAAGADMHHFDVMDGHYVPNLTFGLPILRAIKKNAKIPVDVHIMVTNPDEVAIQYLEAGADVLSFHIEAAKHPHRIIQEIHDKGALAGIAINPGTAVALVKEVLFDVDMVTVMSVNPGFGGQNFIDTTPRKIKELTALLKEIGRYGDVAIEVDGGIDEVTAQQVCESGATVLVAGSYVYHAKNRQTNITALKNVLKNSKNG